MGPYSADLRQRVVAAYKSGEGSMRELADRFAVGVNFVFDMVHLERTTGALTPRPHGGGPRPRLDARGRDTLRAYVHAHNDATLAELCAWLRETQAVVISVARLSRLLTELDLPRKRRPSGPTSAHARR